MREKHFSARWMVATSKKTQNRDNIIAELWEAKKCISGSETMPFFYGGKLAIQLKAHLDNLCLFIILNLALLRINKICRSLVHPAALLFTLDIT